MLGSSELALFPSLRKSDLMKFDRIFDDLILYDLQHEIGRLFIALGQDSGETDYTRFIDLENLREPVCSELRLLFNLGEDTRRLSYTRYRSAIIELANSYIVRSSKIQEIANRYLLTLLTSSVSKVGETLPEDEICSVHEGPETRPPAIEQQVGIFRSISTGPTDFEPDALRMYFVPDTKSRRALDSCFGKFFINKNGTESPRSTDVGEDFKASYGRLYNLFGSDDGIVRRDDFIRSLCVYVENQFRDNSTVEKTVVAYIREKIIKAQRKLDELIASTPSVFDFPVGSKVWYKPFSYNDSIPATVVEVCESTYYKVSKLINYSRVFSQIYKIML